MRYIHITVIIILISVIIFAGCGMETIETNESQNEFTNYYIYSNYNDYYNFYYAYSTDYKFFLSQSRIKSIGLLMAETESVYAKSILKEARVQADKNNIDLHIINSKNDLQNQTDQINYCIRENFDIVVLQPIEGGVFTDNARKIKEANIPLILLTDPVESIFSDLVDVYIGTDNYEKIRMTIEMIVEALDYTGGEIAVIQESLPEGIHSETTLMLINGLVEANLLNGIREEKKPLVAAVEYCGPNRNEAYVIVQKILSEHPKIKLIFCENDQLLIGAQKAIKDARKSNTIKLIGGGKSEEIIELIRRGEIYGTIIESPSWEGAQIVKSALRILSNKKDKIWYKDPLYKITFENVESYEDLW